jgi:transcription elongation factor GreA
MAKIFVTKGGYQKLSDELNHLMTVENKQALEMLKDARDKGDISENAEYETAKEYHENLSNKIATLQDKIKKCEIIYPDTKSDKVNMLSSVEIKNYKTNQVIRWTLVPENEIDIKNGKISFNSPIGAALLGKKKGEVVSVKVPSGDMKLEILDIICDYKF